MTKYVQTGDELLGHLKDQIAFMKISANSYDNGFEDEAKRLAVAIRILVHDTPQSTSLLTQLDKKGILFHSSASNYDPLSLITVNCLTAMRMGPNGADYVAMLDNLPPGRWKKMSFDRWWKREIMYRDSSRNTSSRKDLVINTANTGGGAHIDPKLNIAYANLSRFNSLGWKVFRNNIEDDFKNSPALPSIRQIAHEVLKTLKDEFPELS
ncbi:hypothetical protein ACFLWD_00195 [Chloroflexota bacterium]